jgi:hypothetical protein
MQRITIEIDDEGRASVTAEVDGAEPEMMEFESADEALEAVEDMLEPEAERMPTEEPAEMAEPDMEAMWEEEAAKRPKQANLMA